MSKFREHLPRFRFRLRTVLLLVTLLAISCAGLGSQWMLVRERASLITRIEAAGGAATNWRMPPVYPVGATRLKPLSPWITIRSGGEPVPVSTIRRWMGDQDVTMIVILKDFPDNDEKRILDLFPGTDVVKYPFDNIPPPLTLEQSLIP